MVISLDEGRIRTLNPSGTVLFHALAEQDLSVGDLVTVLANAHPEVDSATLERDVVAFAEDLVTRGLAVVRAP
ncbi:MAG: PqqD family protein [Polyangiaceae bacterium]